MLTWIKKQEDILGNTYFVKKDVLDEYLGYSLLFPARNIFNTLYYDLLTYSSLNTFENPWKMNKNRKNINIIPQF